MMLLWKPTVLHTNSMKDVVAVNDECKVVIRKMGLNPGSRVTVVVGTFKGKTGEVVYPGKHRILVILDNSSAPVAFLPSSIKAI